jgi:hypothetical protein
MTDMDLRIDQARSADILAVVRSLGATLKKTSAAEFEGPCPICGGRDRFSVNVKKNVWNCRGCRKGGDPIDLVMHVQEIGFRPTVEWITGEGKRSAPIRLPPAPPSKATPELEGQARLNQALAKAYAREIGPVRGSPGEQYLREIRQIDTDAVADVLERTDAIGWHPSVRLYEPDHSLHDQKLGCIIGIMTDPVTAKPTGAISRTYLGPDGKKIGKAKTLGRPAEIIRLTPDEDVLGGLHIAEGLETALTGMSKGLRPMWATGSTSIMARFPVVSGIETLTIVTDNDDNGAGQRACEECAARWHAAGREVFIIEPSVGKDLNDAIRLWREP